MAVKCEKMKENKQKIPNLLPTQANLSLLFYGRATAAQQQDVKINEKKQKFTRQSGKTLNNHVVLWEINCSSVIKCEKINENKQKIPSSLPSLGKLKKLCFVLEEPLCLDSKV